MDFSLEGFLLSKAFTVDFHCIEILTLAGKINTKLDQENYLA
jgi:hypothetical protein